MPRSRRNDLIERGRNELSDFVDSVAPTVESTIRSVSESASPILEKGQKMARKERKRLEASLASSLPEPVVDHLPLQSPAKKRRRVRNVLLLGGLAAAGVVVARKLMDSRAEAGWQSTYEPRPSSTPPSGIPTGGPAQEAAAPPTASADDQGAASPGEAMSDQAEHAHADTTPDDPAYVEKLDVAPPSGEQRGV